MTKTARNRRVEAIQSWWRDLRPAVLSLPLPFIYELIAFGVTYGLNPVPPETPRLTVAEAMRMAHDITLEYRVFEGTAVLTLAILYFCIQNHRDKFRFDPGRRLPVDPELAERDQDFMRFLNGDFDQQR